MTKLQALIFDVDGTLADTELYGHRVAFNRAFAEAGLDWDWDASLYGELLSVTGGKERIHFYIESYKPDFHPSADMDEWVVNLHKSKNKHYKQLLTEGVIPLRLGVKRLIEEASNQGIRLAIATTSALPNVNALLEKTLNPSWFEVIAAGDIVPEKKPAPDIYYYVQQQMGLQPQDFLVIEDSYHGLLAATGAGLRTIITVNNYTKNQDFNGALLVLDSLGEPQEPFTVLKGDVGNNTYLNLDLLNQLHSK